MTESNPADATQPQIDPSFFDRLSDDPENRLDSVISLYRSQRRPVELFEALKMKSRLDLGLPMVASGEEDVANATMDQQRKLEDALLDACRQAGAMLIEDGKITEGWMYLRPVGDPTIAKRLLAGVKITDDNYDDMVSVLLHEGVDLARGYQAVIEHQGTCNSITLYDQSIVGLPRDDRAIAAECLLNHFYEELTDLVRQDFRARAGEHGLDAGQLENDATEMSLGDLIAKHQWILGGGGYHLDTTHLSSTVRFATVLTSHNLIERALDLCQYGRRLAAEFQYPGDEPFKEFYPTHTAFFKALLGQDVEPALRLFQQKAQSVDVSQHGTLAIETYIDLLDRVGRPAEALQATMDLFPPEVPTQRVMGELVAMAKRAKESGESPVIQELERFCFDRGDLLTVAALAQL